MSPGFTQASNSDTEVCKAQTSIIPGCVVFCTEEELSGRRFILRPFTVPIATSAVKYTLEKDGYLIEAAADLNKQAPYLAVQKRHGKQVYKAHYAFKEEYAMIETGFAQTDGDLPLVKVCSSPPLMIALLPTPRLCLLTKLGCMHSGASLSSVSSALLLGTASQKT